MSKPDKINFNSKPDKINLIHAEPEQKSFKLKQLGNVLHQTRLHPAHLRHSALMPRSPLPFTRQCEFYSINLNVWGKS